MLVAEVESGTAEETGKIEIEEALDIPSSVRQGSARMHGRLADSTLEKYSNPKKPVEKKTNTPVAMCVETGHGISLATDIADDGNASLERLKEDIFGPEDSPGPRKKPRHAGSESEPPRMTLRSRAQNK